MLKQKKGSNRLNFSFFVLLLLILPALCSGQAVYAPINFDHLTIKDGLSHNTVYCILQDRYGYIWVGTQNGLNKYDGYDFEVIRSNGREEGQHGLTGRKITCLFEDRSGNLWVGTGKHGINYRKKADDRFLNLNHDPAFAAVRGYEISSFFEDSAGHIWITTIGGGLLKYDPQTGRSRSYTLSNSGLSSDVVFDVIEDKYGAIWVGTAGGGLNYLEGEDRFSLSHPMLPNSPNMSGYRKKLYLDDEYLWVGTEGTGLYRMNLKDRSFIHFSTDNGENSISSNVVIDLYKNRSGQLFICTDGGGLNIYDTKTGDITVCNYQVAGKNTLNSNALYCIWGDRTGNIWVGTYNGGLNIYKPGKVWFEFFAPNLMDSEELRHRSILSILQSQNGKIWIGSDGGGLNWISQENSRFYTPPYKHDPEDDRSLAGNIVKTIFEDSRNRLWVGLFGGGLDLFDPGAETFRHLLTGSASVWSIAERKNGRLWVATMGDGIVVLDSGGKYVETLSHDPADPGGLAAEHIMVVFIDREDKVWVGTADKGLDLWEEDKEAFVHHQHDPTDPFSLSDNAVRTIFQDSRGDIWIGTEGGGLNRWLGAGRFERIDASDGLIANSVMGITEDKEGYLWMSTFEGISRLDPGSGTFRNFDFRTIQNANQFNQTAICASENGKVFFGGINGLNAIQPAQLEQKEYQPDVMLTGFQIFNNDVPAGQLPNGRTIMTRPIEEVELLQLSYLDKSFSFQFTATDYTNPLDHEYAYKMEGFDDHWRKTPSGQHGVRYTNLDPGNYTFKVKYKEEVASVDLYIKPPFWQTSWFRILLVVLAAGMILAGLLFIIKRKEVAYKRQLLQLNNEKLASEVEAKNAKLMFSTVQMAHKNEILSDIQKDLREAQQESGANLRMLVRKLDRELKNEDYWKEFNIYFNQVDQHFLQRFLKEHPDLTKNDLRMCSLIRINLSTKEIASLLNISNRAVEQGRYRLKKRLGLGKEEDLDKYITGFLSGD